MLMRSRAKLGHQRETMADNTWSTIGCTCCIYKPSLFCKRQGGVAENTNGVQSRLLEPPGWQRAQTDAENGENVFLAY